MSDDTHIVLVTTGEPDGVFRLSSNVPGVAETMAEYLTHEYEKDGKEVMWTELPA